MPKRILLIDDEDGLRKIIQFSLEAAAGWSVSTASSGQAGLEMAAAEPPDAILLDLMMPDMDGLATFRRLQENDITRSIPVIMLTAKASATDQQSLAELGAAGIVIKPFKIPALITQIRAILDWQD
ncbi:MAG: response regulator transcription factor [Cyanobacteria bacterium RM1_2_2]|nr:response regulator transcription factor [Cyanobacteria bacterium RM1_2_2]